MANKREGAIAMMEQSLIYLLDAYRQEGKSKEEAQALVAQDIERMEKKYADAGIMPVAKKRTTLGDPVALVDEIIKNMEPMRTQSKLFHKAIVQKLAHLKSILK